MLRIVRHLAARDRIDRANRNFAKKAIIGTQRSTEIRYMEPSEGQLMLQGTEMGYGWSIALDTKTGAMSTTLVNREDVFVLFGACTPRRN